MFFTVCAWVSATRPIIANKIITAANNPLFNLFFRLGVLIVFFVDFLCLDQRYKGAPTKADEECTYFPKNCNYFPAGARSLLFLNSRGDNEVCLLKKLQK